ncbi:MAG: DUF3489 domain-containing protein [Rubellimicrobium sp.]|nr:DUF3489 domain-containing protein [Rubellimicrobium sp.]
MNKVTETQSLILGRAASRARYLALPLPEGLHGAAATKVVTLMIGRGWLEEVAADHRKREPLWRETGEGQGTTLIATKAGLEVIGIEPMVASAGSGTCKAKPQKDTDPASTSEATEVPKFPAIRAGTKQAQIIALLQRPEGASIAEIVEATAWQSHTARGMISGALKKKLGLPITAEKVEGRGMCYRLPSK